MAKVEVVVTQTFAQVASGAAVITVTKKGPGAISFNESASDVAAYTVNAKVNEQFSQTEAVATWVKATGDGWEIIVDGAL